MHMTAPGTIRRASACVVAAVAALPFQAGAQGARDSSGVRIVEYARDARAAAEWRVDAKPVLSLGGARGTGATEFATITSAVRSASGHVLVANAGTQEVRVFDAHGVFVRNIGRPGKGPGEFVALEGVSVVGDTVFAADGNLSGSVFTLGGMHVRDVSAAAIRPWIPSKAFGSLANGTFIGTANPLRNATRHRTSPDPEGHFTDTTAVYAIGPKPWEVRVVVPMRGYEMFRARDQALGEVVPFSAVPHVAVFDWRVCLAQSRAYEVLCLRTDGRPEIIIRRSIAQIPVSDSIKAAYVAALHAPQPGPDGAPSAKLAQILARMQFARAYPAFTGFVAARATGEIWISDFRPADRLRVSKPSAEQRRWNVFGPDGAWVGALELPARFRLTDAGTEFVLGVLRDENDVESVVMYRLQRSVRVGPAIPEPD